MSAMGQLPIPLTVALGGTGLTALGASVSDLLSDLVNPDIAWFREDFIGGTNTDGQIGNLGWRLFQIGGAGAATYILGESSHPGIFRLVSGSTSGYAQLLTLAGSGVVATYGSTTNALREVIVFRLGATTSVKFQAGFGNGTTAAPTRHFGIRFDTVAGDTEFMAVGYNADGTQNQASTLGVAADTSWHTAEIERVSATSIRARLDGGSWATISSEVPGQFEYLSPYAFIETATASARSVDLDFIAAVATVSR